VSGGVLAEVCSFLVSLFEWRSQESCVTPGVLNAEIDERYISDASVCVTLGAKPVMEAFALIQEEADALSCCATWFCILMGKLVFPLDCYKSGMQLHEF